MSCSSSNLVSGSTAKKNKVNKSTGQVVVESVFRQVKKDTVVTPVSYHHDTIIRPGTACAGQLAPLDDTHHRRLSAPPPAGVQPPEQLDPFESDLFTATSATNVQQVQRVTNYNIANQRAHRMAVRGWVVFGTNWANPLLRPPPFLNLVQSSESLSSIKLVPTVITRNRSCGGEMVLKGNEHRSSWSGTRAAVRRW
jgi:hypothetical protein